MELIFIYSTQPQVMVQKVQFGPGGRRVAELIIASARRLLEEKALAAHKLAAELRLNVPGASEETPSDLDEEEFD